MLAFFTILIMLGVAYAHFREGLLTAFIMFVNVLVAGLVAFNFWEPIADALEPLFKDSFLEGCEDALMLVVLFGMTLGLLRLIANSLANQEPEYHLFLYRGGGAFFGLLTGYLIAGFLMCVLQTLPVDEKFLGFDYKLDPAGGNFFRKVMPPDRVWLSLMQRAGAYPLANEEDPKSNDSGRLEDRYITFDKYSTFELRYGRFRRLDEKTGQPRPYLGELDREVHR